MRAHPRSRGEHIVNVGCRVFETGSSPLARGTPPREPTSCQRGGLIPARAGNTTSVASRPAMSRAHPRSRGEHEDIRKARRCLEGSSPLARGTLSYVGLAVCATGLIPARAGNTEYIRREAVVCGAHPRSRGEHKSNLNFSTEEQGSSPLARGTQRVQPAEYPLEGLIPARAGNTEREEALRFGLGAHPRSRGEHPLINGL